MFETFYNAGVTYLLTVKVCCLIT